MAVGSPDFTLYVPSERRQPEGPSRSRRIGAVAGCSLFLDHTHTHINTLLRPNHLTHLTHLVTIAIALISRMGRSPWSHSLPAAGFLCLAMVATVATMHSGIAGGKPVEELAASNANAGGAPASIASLESSLVQSATKDPVPQLLKMLKSWTSDKAFVSANLPQLEAALSEDVDAMCSQRDTIEPKFKSMIAELQLQISRRNSTLSVLKGELTEANDKWVELDTRFQNAAKDEKESLAAKDKAIEEFKKYDEEVTAKKKEIQEKMYGHDKEELELEKERDSVNELIDLIKIIMHKDGGGAAAVSGDVDEQKQLKQLIQSKVYKLKSMAAAGADGVSMSKLDAFGQSLEAGGSGNATDVLGALEKINETLEEKLTVIVAGRGQLHTDLHELEEKRRQAQEDLVEQSNLYEDSKDEQRQLKEPLRHLLVAKDQVCVEMHCYRSRAQRLLAPAPARRSVLE